MTDLLQLIGQARALGIKAFAEQSTPEEQDTGSQIIAFSTRKTVQHKLYNWERDVEISRTLGLDSEGWILDTHEMDHGAGQPAVFRANQQRLSDWEVAAYLTSGACTQKEYADFVERARELEQQC